MLFWLKKTLTIPFLPLQFALLVGFFGLVLIFCTRRQKLGRAFLVLALFALAIFSNKAVSKRLIAPLENHYPALPEASTLSELPPAARSCRFVVVLGGGHSDSPGFSRVNQLSSSALGRLVEGVRLVRLLPATKLIVSGFNSTQTISHAQVLSEAARSLGIASDRIVRFDHTRDTDDEAQALVREVGAEPFILVTSAWHMPRAMALCKKAGLDPIAAPADFMQRPENEDRWSVISWDIGSLEKSTKAIHERLGFLWAKLMGKS